MWIEVKGSLPLVRSTLFEFFFLFFLFLRYHMECLNPPLSEVPVDEWFCPACAPMGVSAAAGKGFVVSIQSKYFSPDLDDVKHVLF